MTGPAADTPREAWPARADEEGVHLVDAPDGALLDPSPYRTRCGRQPLELYNDRRAATCPDCLGERAAS